MRNRKKILQDLINYNKNIIDLQMELSLYERDVSEPLITIFKESFSIVLNKYLANEISTTNLIDWANTIECRDDLEFESESLQEVLFLFSSPEINGEITKEYVNRILAKLNEK
ncbi:hypothetical protein [Lentimicrobium sp. S6]|uniref:hypothetical protein n=1 Tax=Lentimicrobium sp. S6 TaxID=2735872 RepID=UPI0015544AF1|nr:hypothetical protein [Lentimicrobium sp. S6]NPD47902.1 hypothetical protein [Lentimicrobium sp. S6]